jgi:hypothetical protein
VLILLQFNNETLTFDPAGLPTRFGALQQADDGALCGFSITRISNSQVAYSCPGFANETGAVYVGSIVGTSSRRLISTHMHSAYSTVIHTQKHTHAHTQPTTLRLSG